MLGYDQLQYVNLNYPYPYHPPFIDIDIPSFHYRKHFSLQEFKNLFLCFDGADAAFYVYINQEFVGYSQISHSLSEFEITKFAHLGDNTIDVIVLKWCASSYLEDQDKFRFTGIFRDVYLLNREDKYIKDFKIETSLKDNQGFINATNLSAYPFNVLINNESKEVLPNMVESFAIDNPILWNCDNPYLYDVVISNEHEKILQRVGVRTVTIENGVFKINGKHIKLKGVNRHEFSPFVGASITRQFTYDDLKLIKSLNVNAIRTSHYPNIPEFYDICDALGIYVVDEADVETHGAATSEGGYKIEPWEALTESGIYDDAVTDREISLYERDKNHTCVVIWSIGNESSYGKMFYQGIDYIKAHDSRPIHYEGIFNIVDKSINGKYYTKRIDIISRMYPPYEFMKNEYLKDKNETRPLLLCEYSHAMGNSPGDLADYWRIINSNDRFIGAFVWEFNDHAIYQDGHFLYGGDFGEKLHDNNFCVDGLVTPDRKLKSGALEMKAVYRGKLYADKKVNKCHLEKNTNDKKVECQFDDKTGSITSIKVDDVEILTSPLTISFLRAYIDNDMHDLETLKKIENGRINIKEVHNYYPNILYKGEYLDSDNELCFNFDISYYIYKNTLQIYFKYEVVDSLNLLPRFGITFSTKDIGEFTYFGYGPHESYIDKCHHVKMGQFKGNSKDNYTHYIKPQESGSHYFTSYIKSSLFDINADTPFSFNIMPYSFNDLTKAKHDFELPKSKNSYIYLDHFMSGVGSHACGPELKRKYCLSKKGEHTFQIVFK